jgi:hypothetical protein
MFQHLRTFVFHHINCWPFWLVATLLFWKVDRDAINVIWMERWAILLAVLAAVFAVRVGKRVSWFAAPVTFTTLISGIFACFWFQRYNQEVFELQSTLRQSAGMATIVFLLGAAALMDICYDKLTTLRRSLVFAGLVMSLAILYAWVGAGFGRFAHVPILTNPSMAGSLAAVSLFLVNDYKVFRDDTYFRNIHWVIVTTACLVAWIFNGASAPIIAIIAGLGGWGGLWLWNQACDYESKGPYWHKYPFFAIFWAALGLTPFIALALTTRILHRIEELASNSGRFQIWGWALDWFANSSWSIILFGSGVGTTRVLLPIIEKSNPLFQDHIGWWWFTHNDWLQIMLEQGLVGIFSAMILAFGVLWNSRRNPQLFRAVCAYGVVMFSNFPLHWALHALMGFTLVALVFERRNHEIHQN